MTGLREHSPIPPFTCDDEGPEYLYITVAEHLAARIRSGELPVRARLPGERDLAVEYGVAIGTVRRATRVLRARGLVVTLPAKGTYVLRAPCR
ncbi:GntR family transcriptional regulator [Actinobacteria bacterium YIM 96077]|uniref:GntR family transcriptional regulator n=1 Tax=Phytoactinopolyspora halophila TaxID=1981511 RepID=A0A329QST6_9ACTN|nr:winged helix-turn-helix domain-containing protein [Phytoactinopolyspora halophila]AYY14879.1 GntR family transcriptional regulator [Actinobacteria bacterium YIM 96077]RAW15337.1 GntR family transcriptional regulator [Phytoactinopolyspora halophila]